MSHISSSNRREGRKNKGSLKNSYKLEQGNDQNVNGDTAMNTDRVQPQLKRSHLSVNIQPVSGITTRQDLEETGQKTAELTRSIDLTAQHAPLQRPQRVRWLLSGFNFVPSGSLGPLGLRPITGGEQMGR